jgi:4-hydroxybenzoate polyprenyltransferase/phosphoserine phosphatase
MTAVTIEQSVPTAISAELPLCVDLDGTLIHTDSLAEAVLSACGDVRLALAAARLPLAGRAAFKQEVARLSRVEIRLLPYNEELVAYLQGQKAAGRRIVLATAADRAIAEAVAAHLGVFDEVIASDGDQNLKGPRKAEALCARFGERGFVYAGDDVADLAVWKRAAGAILVNTTPGLARRAERIARVEGRFAGPPRSLKTVARALRPHQWLKNLLVFVPIFTAHVVTDVHVWLQAALTFAAFCATASAIYLVNDATDLSADRKHPRKRKRPLASGALSVKLGLVMAGLLAATGVGLAVLTGTGLVLAAYAAMSVSYSLKFKEMPLVDVFMLGGLYTIRVFGGGVATGHALSLWLLGFSGFLFLGLALLKRVTELSGLSRKQERVASRRGYSIDDLPILQTFGCAASFASSLVLALFVQREATAEQYASPGLLWGIVPLMLFWQCRLWLSTARGYMHDDPIVYSGRDWVSWMVGASVMLLLLVAHSVSF